MGGITFSGPHGTILEPRKLTIAELETYLRRGCSCVVCEYARAEIRERQKEAADAATP